MKKVVIYVHGKGGNAQEAEHYKPLFENAVVVGFDYKSDTPWDAKREFQSYFGAKRQEYDDVTVIANSIGAFFTLSALSRDFVDRAYFISPVVDMERLITDMMSWAGVDESELEKRGEIATDFGETLSYEYLRYVRNNKLSWEVITSVLYGEHDNLTSIETITKFSEKTGATLTVMNGGEHWFHTDGQMAFLDAWLKKEVQNAQ